MPRVTHVVDERLRIDYGFMYEFRTPAEVEDYWRCVGQKRWSLGFADYTKNRDASHAELNEGNVLKVISELRGESGLLTLGRMVDASFSGMLHCLPVLVNSNGGYFALTDRVTIKSTQEIETWTLPTGAKIKISQWPNGTHFYAKVGDEDVVLFSRRKWDTREDAQRAAERFAKENNIIIVE